MASLQREPASMPPEPDIQDEVLHMNHVPTSQQELAGSTTDNGNAEKSSTGPVPAHKDFLAKVGETWTLEIAGFLVALVCLAATVILLRVYDNQVVPSWPVTPNFVLSLLANIGFSGTLLGVHAAVQQLKWVLYSKGARPMASFSLFQRARAGGISAGWLFVIAGAHFTVITGAAAIVLAMLWTPFTQNLIRYESGNITDSNGIALLPRSVIYNSYGLEAEFDTYYPDPLLELNTLTTLLHAPSDKETLLDVRCSTGECTWPPVATLAYCCECVDLSSEMELNCENRSVREPGHKQNLTAQKCSVQLPGGESRLGTVDTDNPYENVANTTTSFDDKGLVFNSIRLLPPYEMDGGRGRPFRNKSSFGVTSCSLSLCVKSLQASVRGNVYTEDTLESYTTQSSTLSWYAKQLQPPWGEDRGIDPSNNYTFGLSQRLVSDARSGQSFITSLAGSVDMADGHTGFTFCEATTQPLRCIESSLIRSIFNARYDPKTCGSPNNDTFACVMHATARALTTTMRNSGIVANGTDIGDEFLVRGTTFGAATFIRVQWYWILLPLTVWLLGVVTWAAVAFQTRRMGLPMWRDDPLPLFFLYREDSEKDGEEGRDNQGRGDDKDGKELLRADGHSVWAYEQVAEKLNVRLQRNSALAEGGDEGAMRLVSSRA